MALTSTTLALAPRHPGRPGRPARASLAVSAMVAVVALGTVPAVAAPTGAVTAEVPTLQVVVPRTLALGASLDVTLVVHGIARVAAFEASINVDPAVATFSGMKTAASTPDGAALTPLGAVVTDRGVNIGGYACTGPGCSKPAPVAATSGPSLASAEFDVGRAGVIGVLVDHGMLTDASGRVLRRFGPIRAEVVVGRDTTPYPAPAVGPPAQARRPAGPGRNSYDVTGDGRVNVADVAEEVHAWTLARERGGPCGALAEPSADVNRDGCIDIADVQSVADHVGLSYHGGGSTVAGRPVRTASPVTDTVSSPVTYTVNSTADGAEAGPPGTCQTSNPGECTLRAALQEADLAQGPATIAFGIPGSGIHTIVPGSQLPSLSNVDGITIDGYTQPGSSPNTSPLVDNAVPGVELIGQGPMGIDGFFMGTSNNLIRGVDMHNFQRAIWIDGANAGSNVVVGDILGLLPNGNYDGHTFLFRNSSCVVIQGGAHDNVVGRPNMADRNTISGCAHQGIATYDRPTTRNTFQNNIVGLSPDGTQRRGNQSHGIDINTWTTYTLVGGTGPMQHNVLSGNFQEGAEISHGTGTLYNKIVGNYIGTDVTGNNAPAFAEDGQFGVHLEGVDNCNDAVCPLDSGFATVSGNVIVDAQEGGVMVDKGFHDSVVSGNLIGETLNGTPAGNKVFGVRIEAGSIRITVGPGNIISNNSNDVQIEAIGVGPPDPVPSPTNFNTITRNVITNSVNSPHLPIDLAPWATVNQNGNGDPNVNEQINIPVLTAPNAATVLASTSTGAGKPCAGCVVELFQAGGAAGSYGGSAAFLTHATTDSSGHAVLYVPAADDGQVVTATATTALGSTSEFARNVAVPNPTDHHPPSASFTVSCTHLACATDGSGSSDTDGAVVRYQWKWGDGATSAGVNPTHVYQSPGGSFVITLTVTDEDNNTASTTRTVVVSLPANTVVSDSFSRTVGGGWGDADVGGAWNYGAGMAPSFSVDGSEGLMLLPSAGSGRFAFTPSVSGSDVDLFADVGTNQAPTGGYGETVAVVGRRIGLNQEYRARARFPPGGGVDLAIVKLTGSSSEMVIGTEVQVAGLTYSPGAMFTIHLQISGTDPTVLNARIWPAGDNEPANWNVSVTDSEPALQTSGAAGVEAFLGGGSTGAPVSVLVDNVLFRLSG